MKPSETTAIRAEIQAHVNAFFRRSISIDERAMQTLEHSSVRNRAPNPRHILSAAFKLYPALAAAFAECGISINPGFLASVTAIDTPAVYPSWDSSLSLSFEIGSSARLSPSGCKVRDTGVLTIEDLILGPIEVEGTSPRHSNAQRHTLWYMTEKAVLDSIKTPLDLHVIKGSRVKYYAKLWNNLCQIPLFDPCAGQQQFLLQWDGRQFRFQPFGLWGGFTPTDIPLKDGSLWVARGNVLQPSTAFSPESISELEYLVNHSAKEQDFQHFFEARPEFLLALGDYIRIHPQLVLAEDSGSRLIPDFFLEKLDSNFCDICDLKLPTTALARYQFHRLRFRDAIMEAVAQLDHYRDWFEESSNQKRFQTVYGLRGFRPKVVLVIGRSANFYDEIDRIRLESRLPAHIVLRTYDDIVAKARQWRKLVHGTV